MSNVQKILDIDIQEVLAKLGYYPDTHYKVAGNSIKMKEGGKVTNGWNGQLRGPDGKGFLKCQSGKKPGRFEGDNLNMVMDKLQLTKAEAITWFEDNFNLPKNQKREDSNNVKTLWNKLPSVDENQIRYLHSRKIKPSLLGDLIRDYEGSIALSIVTANDTMTSFQGRNTSEDGKKNRYRILKGYPAKGLFADFKNIDPKKEVLLVEGMTDYLTLRQFTPNVIALVAKGNGIEEIKALKNKYKFIFIPDNDIGGEEALEALADINMGVFKLSLYEEEGIELKDTNDFWVYCLSNGLDGEGMVNIFLNECIRPLTNIQQALRKAMRKKDNEGILTGEKTFDWATGGIVLGTTYVLNGPSGQGKTTWAMWMLMKAIKQGRRVGFFSQETETGKMLAQVLGFIYGKQWKKEILPNIEHYINEYGIDNLSNLFLFDDIRTLNDIDRTIKEEKLEVVFIDYAQAIQGLRGDKTVDKFNAYGVQTQHIARENYAAVISLSQVPMSQWVETPVRYRTPKEASGLKESADTFINVGIYNGQHKVAFGKCKEGDDDAWFTEYDTTRDRNTGDIGIFKDENISQGF